MTTLTAIDREKENKATCAAGDSTGLREANQCIGLGVGVGALGAAPATLVGAVCPLCVVVAPGLIGFGAYKRYLAKKQKVEK